MYEMSLTIEQKTFWNRRDLDGMTRAKRSKWHHVMTNHRFFLGHPSRISYVRVEMDRKEKTKPD